MGSRRLGPIMQVAYLVEDLDEAVAHWAGKLGVGPFFISRHVPYSHFSYLGKASAPDMSLAFAYSGELNIELMQQHNEAPSAYQDFIRKNGFGVQHVGVVSEDLEADTQYLADSGIKLVQRLVNPNGVETRFFDTEIHPGAMLELIQRSATLDQGFAYMKRAAEKWDGVDPIGK